ncbi:7tm Odorant receptor [Popillia japonica]|uniref:7tm Odorant receptor n=1 Tax=Popillia japonica TaxID=7064 RepID=A0AAW1LSS3_POPJA
MEAVYDMGGYIGIFPLKDQIKEYRRDVLNIVLIVYVAVGIVWFGVTVLMTYYSLVDELNKLYAMNNAPAVFLHSAIIGVCLFSLTIKYSMKAALIALGFTGGAFYNNFSGQMIFERSQTVSDAAYNMDWYNANASKDIKFIIMRSQVPLSYRAGPFGTMSFVFFGNILRGAYTYMTMQTDLKEK